MELEGLVVRSEIIYEQGSYMVKSTWSYPKMELDRTDAHTISCGKDKKLAERLSKAINAQKVFTNMEIVRDLFNHTYVWYNSAVIGRHLNADLKKLGF